MSNEVEQAGQPGPPVVGYVIELDPDDILVPEITNVRPWSTRQGNSDKELEDLEALGVSIADDGQIEPIVVTPSLEEDGPKYALIAGRRRRLGVRMYNQRVEADKKVKLQAVVKAITADKKRPMRMYQTALHENVQRKNLNQMDFAENCKFVREKLSGPKDRNSSKVTQKVAEFFKVSPATITQAEKLLDLPEDLQLLVAIGELSGEGAQDLIKATKGIKDKEEQQAKRQEIFEKAKELHATEQATAAVEVEGEEEAEPAPKKKKARKTKTVKAKHVRTAARQVTGQSTKRSRSEILEFFRGQLGPVNGHPNGSIHLFCDGLLSWAEGKVSDKKLNALWDDLVEKAFRGTPEKKEEKKEAAATKPAAPRSGAAGKPAPRPRSAKKSGKSKKKK
jgi:ParB/RepB/Spo0J family partition protein